MSFGLKLRNKDYQAKEANKKIRSKAFVKNITNIFVDKDEKHNNAVTRIYIKNGIKHEKV